MKTELSGDMRYYRKLFSMSARFSFPNEMVEIILLECTGGFKLWIHSSRYSDKFEDALWWLEVCILHAKERSIQGYSSYQPYRKTQPGAEMGSGITSDPIQQPLPTSIWRKTQGTPKDCLY